MWRAQEGGAGWQEREVTVFGRRVMQPRLVAYMADDASLAYTYSGTTMVPQPWTEPVRRIKVWPSHLRKPFFIQSSDQVG